MRSLLALAVTVGTASAGPRAARADAPAVDPAIVAAIAKLEPAHYPSANSVVVVSDQAVVYQPDGQFTNTFHVVRAVLTQAGKAALASDSIDYAKDAEHIDLAVARVIKRDGKVIDVPKSAIQDTEQSGDANIYDPNGRAIKITFAGLAVGDAVELTYTLTRKLPTRVGFFNDIFPFQDDAPVLESSYTVDGPAALPLTAQLYHPERTTKIATTRAKVGDRIHYAWAVRDVPQLVPEPAMSHTTELPLLVVTTDPSWVHFSSWWGKLTETKMVATPELKAKVKELVADAKTDEDKIKKLYDFVAQDIRYRGLGVGPRTGYTPRAASETMTSRWGVCRDVAILLATMLRESGVQAYPVITNVGDPVLPKVAYDGFNHAIVALPKPGGGWRYLDPTAKNNTDLLPGNEAQQDTLVATPTGEPLSSIPALPATANLGHAIATTTIGAGGEMTSTVTFETKGVFDMIVRSVAMMMSPDQQREAIEQVVHHALPDAKLAKVAFSNPNQLYQPMKVTFELSVPSAATKAGSYRLLRTAVTSGALGLVEAILPEMLGALPTRKYGLDAQLTFAYDQDETVTLPAGTKLIALPNPARASSAVSEATATCTSKDATTLTCHRSFQLKSRFIAPAQYKELRAGLAAMAAVARQPVIVGGAQ